MTCASLHAYLLLSKLSGSATTEPILSCLRFYISTQVSPVSHIVYTISLGIFALLRLSSALPDPVPRLPSLGSGVCFVCVCARTRIQLHVIPATLVITCHWHWSFYRGINDTCYNTFWIEATKGHSTSTIVLRPERLALPSFFLSILSISSVGMY